jgi:hypothetical protein
VSEEPVVVERAGVKLRGVLWRPAHVTGHMPIALIIGGSGPTDRDGNQGALATDSYRLLAVSLARAGIASIRYDKRGIGASDRVAEASLSFTDLVEDAAAFAAFARKDKRFTKLTVIGHSEGGLVAIQLGDTAPHPDALVLVATPGRPLWQVIHEQLARRGQATEHADAIMAALRDGKPVGEYPRELARLFRPSVETFLRSEIALDPAALLAKVSIPVAIVQGETDVQVSVADARLLHAKRKNARLWLLPRVNHVLKEEAALSPEQESYTDASRPLGPGVADAIASSVAR